MGILGFTLGGPLGGDLDAVVVTPVDSSTGLVSFDTSGAQNAPIVRDLLLDANGDLDVGSGDAQLAADEQAVVQGVQGALGLIKGEWFLDLDSGFDLFGAVLVSNPNTTLIEKEVRDTVLAVPGVTGITSLTLTLDRVNRTLSAVGQATWSKDALADAARNPA